MRDKTLAPDQMSAGADPHHAGSRLGSFLCWGVVFADLGTSVYYVPGILYGQYERLAGFFVILTLSVFVLLTLKYAEVTERFPEGGGVVTVSSRALGPWAGAFGGMLILVDYFLTASLSSLSGLTYFDVVAPGLKSWVLWATVGVLVVLGLLNWWGIKESASVSAIFAAIAFISDLVVLIYIFARVPLPEIGHVFTEMFAGHAFTPKVLITGYAGAFLAFSGLESISQLSPVMRVPRRRVAGWALAITAVTVGITSPLLTVFSTTLLCQRAQLVKGVLECVTPTGRGVDPNQFISALGGAYAGPWLAVAVAVSASALLVFASNTAIIGSYHVFLALTRMRFFPPVIIRYNRLRGTPHVAILLATAIPIAILIAARGQIDLLGDMYAFGLLGAFTLTSIGLDVVRFRERRGAPRVGPTKAEEEAEEVAQHRGDEIAREHIGPLRRQLEERASVLQSQGASISATLHARELGASLAPFARAVHGAWSRISFGVGVVTTLLVITAWCTNIVNKPLATEFGGTVTALGLLVAGANHYRQERAGKPAVYPIQLFGRIPNSLLVVLPVGSSEAAEKARSGVVRAAAEYANERKLIFLYMSPIPVSVPTRLMEINDPYTRDPDAQHAFSQAAAVARGQGASRRNEIFVYRTGKMSQVADVWRITRPEATVAQADQGIARIVQPGYVRFQEVGKNGDRTRVAFYVHQTPAASGVAWPRPIQDETASRSAASQGQRPAPAKPPASDTVPRPGGETATGTNPAAPEERSRSEEEPSQLPPVPTRPGAETTRPSLPPAGEESRRAGEELDALLPPETLAEAERYVWTGTELKRRDELEEEPTQGRDRTPSKPEA